MKYHNNSRNRVHTKVKISDDKEREPITGCCRAVRQGKRKVGRLSCGSRPIVCNRKTKMKRKFMEVNYNGKFFW